jgi:hypothetical protein
MLVIPTLERLRQQDPSSRPTRLYSKTLSQILKKTKNRTKNYFISVEF